MRAGRGHRIGVLAGSVAAAGLMGAATRADASLIIDLRATALNGQPLSAGNTPKDIQVGTGDTVTLALFGVVSGTNGVNDEGLTSVHGSIISMGSLRGNLAGGTVAPFSDSGSQNGSVQDLDGDGDLDIGVAPNGGTPTTGYFIARAAALQTNGTVVNANTEEFQIGQFTFTVTGSSGELMINFVRRANASGGNITTAGVWAVDGFAKSPVLDTFVAGPPVGVPEPSSAAVAAAALGLLPRRQNRGR